jgi:hypothetical protein
MRSSASSWYLHFFASCASNGCAPIAIDRAGVTSLLLLLPNHKVVVRYQTPEKRSPPQTQKNKLAVHLWSYEIRLLCRHPLQKRWPTFTNKRSE